jgi:hypothetical protein
MKHRTLLIALSLAFSSLALSAADWSSVAEKVAKSAVFVESAEGSCTGSVINASAREKKDKDFILTAAHCYGEKQFADHMPASVVYKDEKSNRDVMILEVEDTGRPALGSRRPIRRAGLTWRATAMGLVWRTRCSVRPT